MQVDLFASLAHYREHLLPVWQALPESVRGVDHGSQLPGRSHKLLLVASYVDLKTAHHRQCVYVEHGAGQSYVGLPASVAPYYSPIEITKQHRNVVLFLCPNDEVAARWSRSYDRPAVVVGCPKLDPWHTGLKGEHEPRTVAITFHWEPPASVWVKVPEMQSAFGCYSGILQRACERFIEDGWKVLGHAHPKALALQDFWRKAKIECPAIEIAESSEVVTDRAELIIADNTSMQAEFMSLGRGVVFLNHPAYRKDVEHGGRFWQWPEKSGVQIDTPRNLVALDLDSVPASTWHPYAYDDGRAAERAVAAILSLS